MALRRNNNRENFSLDLTTCSDIIFTLLLFYILTQNFLPQTPLELPPLAGTEQSSNSQQRVEISATGQITWNGNAVASGTIVTLIRQKVSAASQSQIIIYAHSQSPAGISIELLDHLRRAGITSVAFAGRPAE